MFSKGRAAAGVTAALLLVACGTAGDAAPPTSSSSPAPTAGAPTADPTGEPAMTPPEPSPPGSTGGTGGTPAEGSVPPGPPGPPGPSETDEGVLTQDDDGRLVELAVDQEVPLRLDPAWTWDPPVADAVAVTLTPVDHLVDPGYVEWLVVGAEPGSATVTVSGEPACGDSVACPPREVVLLVEVR